MVEPVSFNLSEIKFETGIRKDASLVMAVLQKNGKLPNGLTVQNIEAILNTLSPETCKPLIEAIVKHGSEDNLNASLKELGIIAEALKPGSTAKFAIENGKLKITKDKEFELIDGKDGESEGSRAALAEVTGDYDAFVKETLNIKPAPGAPPKVEAEKVKLAVKAPMTLDYFIGKGLEGKLSVDDLKEKRLPDDVESIFKTDKKISITDVEKIAILNILCKQGYFGAAKEYEAGKKGVFSAEGIAFSFSGAGSAFRDEFFKTPGELLSVNSSELKSVVYSLSRSFEVSQKLGRTTGSFEAYANEFINASAYITKTISSSEDGAKANLSKKLSVGGGPSVTPEKLAGLAKAFAGATFNQQTNLPISNGSGAQLTIDPKDDKKVVLSVSAGGVFKPVMSFAKDDWDKIVDGTKDIKEGKDLWLLNFLEFMTQEKDDKVQTWENRKITDKTYIKEGKNIEIKDEVVDFKKVVDGITGIPPKIETLDMLALPPDASQPPPPPPPAGTPPMSQPHPATGKQSIKLEGFVPPAGVTPDPRFGLLQGITVKDNYSNTYMIIEKKDVTPTTYHLVRMDINQKGAAFNKTPIPTGANTFNFQMGGLSVTKEFGEVGALVPAPGGNQQQATKKAEGADQLGQKTPQAPGQNGETPSDPPIGSAIKMKDNLPPLFPGMKVKVSDMADGGITHYSLTDPNSVSQTKVTPVVNGEMLIPETDFWLLKIEGNPPVIKENIKATFTTNKTKEDLIKLIDSPLGSATNVDIYLKDATDLIAKDNIVDILKSAKDKQEVFGKLLKNYPSLVKEKINDININDWSEVNIMLLMISVKDDEKALNIIFDKLLALDAPKQDAIFPKLVSNKTIKDLLETAGDKIVARLNEPKANLSVGLISLVAGLNNDKFNTIKTDTFIKMAKESPEVFGKALNSGNWNIDAIVKAIVDGLLKDNQSELAVLLNQIDSSKINIGNVIPKDCSLKLDDYVDGKEFQYKTNKVMLNNESLLFAIKKLITAKTL